MKPYNFEDDEDYGTPIDDYYELKKGEDFDLDIEPEFGIYMEIEGFELTLEDYEEWVAEGISDIENYLGGF